ncbi:hypothetical protein FZC84_05065 [Rossellomorea vietnamensis]|uniref:Myb-like domain-containing protein n=1 Tax=Rossellomorea vietnamensis TaxID=218284 RepID=A0A5D4MG60_9BACI|nr:hypothetical protein [Rossellomorea vietnamensis]TYS00865.1 hypothetical protein FZC84_05065 [Rossellomorea vietnamensis]
MDKGVEKKRKWTEEEESILSDIVLTFSNDGKTQREAFEKAAHTIGRTPGACSFRWNNKLKKAFGTAGEEMTSLNLPTLADCISFLETFTKDEELAVENVMLKEKQDELKKKLDKAEAAFVALKKKYKELLLQIDTLDTSLQP